MKNLFQNWNLKIFLKNFYSDYKYNFSKPYIIKVSLYEYNLYNKNLYKLIDEL